MLKFMYMKSIDNSYKDLMVINKSKFYSFAYPVMTEEDIKSNLDNLREQFSDATHICYAYSLSSPRLEKADDNGEPSGTAGKPILELIKKRGIENVLVAVVRYFGGIKLGAGGLVRAYTNSANLVLDKAKIVNMITITKYRAVIDIPQGAKLMDSIRNLEAQMLACEYGEKVEIEFVGNIKDKLIQMYPSIEIKEIGSELICEK